MSDDLERLLAELRVQFLGEVPARLAELRAAVGALEAGGSEAAVTLRMLLHRLKGASGSYGFPDVFELTRDLEAAAAAVTSVGPVAAAPFRDGVGAIEAAFSAATVALAHATAARPALADWTVRLTMTPGPLRDAVAGALREAGATVSTLDRVRRGSDKGEPPELVTLRGPGSVDPLRATILVAQTSTGLGRARQGGYDAVLPADGVEQRLLRLMRAFDTWGVVPPSILLVRSAPDGDTSLVAALEAEGLTVVTALGNAGAQAVFETERPEVVVLDPTVPEADLRSLSRVLRHDSRLALVPLITLLPTDEPGARLEALRAGADDSWAATLAPSVLAEALARRAAAGRLARRLAHRDAATGLYTEGALLAELAHAADHARRHGGEFALLLLSLDHLEAVRQAEGHVAAEAVMVQAGELVRRSTRSTDLAARFGGTEFALLLRDTGADGAAAVAAKVQRALAANAVTVGDRTLPLSAQVGLAAYPHDGHSAAGLVRAADRAVRR